VKEVVQAKWKVLLRKEMLNLSTSSAVRSSSPCWILSSLTDIQSSKVLIVQRSNSSLLTTMFQQFSLPREALNMQSKFLKDSRMKVGKKSLKSFQEKA